MEVPKEVKSVIAKLKKKGFEAYIVGGCVRDFLRNVVPEDWDIASSAKPEEIQKVFNGSADAIKRGADDRINLAGFHVGE